MPVVWCSGCISTIYILINIFCVAFCYDPNSETCHILILSFIIQKAFLIRFCVWCGSGGQNTFYSVWEIVITLLTFANVMIILKLVVQYHNFFIIEVNCKQWDNDFVQWLILFVCFAQQTPRYLRYSVYQKIPKFQF